MGVIRILKEEGSLPGSLAEEEMEELNVDLETLPDKTVLRLESFLVTQGVNVG